MTFRATPALLLAFSFGSWWVTSPPEVRAPERPSEAKPTARTIRYGRDVRPILSDRCFHCHGADDATREAGLRLDQREGVVGDWGVVVPGDVEASELWWRITEEDDDLRMPPRHANKTLSEEEIAILEQWILEGAEYEPHWSFVAPEKYAAPEVENAEWARDDIDRFVLSELERRGIEPSPQAEFTTLVRRIFLDLTGLPPTDQEVVAFDRGLYEMFGDTTPPDFEGQLLELVDRLLTEEPWRTRVGEHFASSWLDAARYADTIGIHTDNGRQMWLWREWVIGAFRDNLPYDEFVTQQLAGDLLPDATTATKIASGFNRNHVATDEGGAIAEEYLVEYAVDRVATTSSVFLGLTAGCARCHDHKYDPLTQEDFYGLVGFFNSVEEPGLYSQLPDPNRAFEPFLEVPTEEQDRELLRIATRLAEVETALAEPLPQEDERFAAFLVDSKAEVGVDWTTPEVLAARSSDERVELAIEEDGSVTASGPVPAFEDYVIELGTETASQLLLLEALATPNPDPNSDTPDGAGRASHGNAVLSQLVLEQRAADGEWQPVPLRWGWADHEQQNGDFAASNVIDADPLGWAVDGNADAGARTLMLLADAPFGTEGARTELRVTLAFRSRYEAHSLGRVRFRVSSLGDFGRLPVAFGRWYELGPFRADPEAEASQAEQAYSTDHGVTRVDLAATYGPGELTWRFDQRLVDGEPVELFDSVGAGYVGRTIWSPDERTIDLEIGSDDGFALTLNGEEVLARRVDRGVANAQDTTRLSLAAGRNELVYRIVNTGGPSGYAFRPLESESVLLGELPSALLEEGAIPDEQRPELAEAWRRRFFEGYRLLDDERIALGEEREQIREAVPRTMVMSELVEPRPSYVLERGQYDHADETRRIERRAPTFLPPLPTGAPENRLGFAQWLTAPENPLFARVAVNRFWQHFFGTGLVATSEDFGLQGEWPSHPELLDTLAVEFRESGWDVHALLKRIVTSRTYWQSSKHRLELDGVDPGGRLLARYPRRRLSAEQIRDLALFASGLLVEELGGPSVKPYQPEGLWREVSMLQSNTRDFERGDGDDLWRRSVYTYWKRAVPPPALQTFDAPTRESCVIRRSSTNTPLQALVLWNDEQFVEAARVLAERIVRENGELGLCAWSLMDADGTPNDTAACSIGVTRLFLACTGREPERSETKRMVEFVHAMRKRYEGAPEEALALLEVGEAPRDEELEPAEVAAWTLAASAVLNLHETLTQR